MCARVHFLFGALFIFQIVDAGFLTKNKISFVKTEYVSSDPKIMDLQLNIQERSPNVQEVSGFVHFSAAMDTKFFTNFLVKRSRESVSCDEMKPMPLLRLPEKDGKAFMNDIYRPFVMENARDCSDMPQFKGDWGDRSLAGNYTVNKCFLETDGLQPVLSVGHYCLSAVSKKDAEPKFESEFRIYVKVE